MLLSPFMSNFRRMQSNITVPAKVADVNGAAVTPGNNTMGSFTNTMATPLAFDGYFIVVNVHGNEVAGAARDTLINIVADPAGGTSYTKTLIPYLVGSCAGNQSHSGLVYGFPLFIPAGCSIGIQAQINQATVGNFRCCIWIFGEPRQPELCHAGTYIEAIGYNTGTSAGTAITPGNGAEGAWVALTTNLARPCWWWQVGMGVNDLSMSALGYTVDLSADNDTTTPQYLVEDDHFQSGTNEQISKQHMHIFEVVNPRPAGSSVYGRARCTGAPDSNVSLVAYGVGG